MVFSSFPFLWIFLPIVLTGAILTQKKGSNLFLLVMSLLFYAWGEPKYIVLLLLTISLNYACGLLIDRQNNTRQRKLLTAIAVTGNVLLLGYFKYFNFFAESLNSLLHSEFIPLRKISLPIGISFYTFQAISYIVDLYRGTIVVQRSWTDLALYISFFPQLIAGPIVKYKDISDSLHNRTLTLDKTVLGLKRFCFGMAKKVLLANTLGYAVDEILSHPINDLSALLCWTAAVFYTLQIYFDFSGYSDMAIGLANVFGFTFRENFNLPYISTSIREFWRRWHISLSTWFRDYLYIPLGGNRKGTVRTGINLLIVFFTTGLWHGAQWNFVIWGLYYGVLLIFEKYYLTKYLTRIPKILQHLYTMLMIVIGWVFFFSESAGSALKYLGMMVGIGSKGFLHSQDCFVIVSNWGLWLAGIICCTSIGSGILNRNGYEGNGKWFTDLAYMMLFVITISWLITDSFNPFLYFRF